MSKLEYGAITEPRWLDEAKTKVLCKVAFPHIGEEPVAFVAAADDDMEHGREIFADLIAGKYGPVGLYAAPKPVAPLVPETITDVAFFGNLAKGGHITQAEALAAVTVGTLPKAMADAIDALGKDDQFDARMYLRGSTALSRNNPAIGKVLHLAFDMDDAGVLALFAGR